MRTFSKGKIRLNPDFHQKKLPHDDKTNIVESSLLFLMGNCWCRQGEETLNLYRVNAVASYTLLRHGWRQRHHLPPSCDFHPVNRRHSSRITPFQFSGKHPSHKAHEDKGQNPELLWDG